MTAVVVVGAEVDGVAGVGVRMAGGLVTDVGADVRPVAGDAVIDARGGAVIPGLHDHHIHLRALAAEASSVRVGRPAVRSREDLAAALRAAPGPWVRATGYHESVAGSLDRWALDALLPDRPLRVQHRSGVLWMLNSAAVEQTGLDKCTDDGVERDQGGRPTGRLWRMDAWIGSATPSVPVDLCAVGEALARQGITGVTDADPRRDLDDVAALAAVPQRVHVMGPAGLSVDGGDRLTLGPVKLVLDDRDLPTPESLAAAITGAHTEDRPVAVHCVTRVQLVVLLAALDITSARPGDRIEHASVVPAELIPRLVAHGLTVVTQPGFVAERGDQYALDVAPEDQSSLYRCRSLIDAGVVVAAGTDAPHGRPDPWASIAAAVHRTTEYGAVLGADEAVAPRRALDLYLGSADEPGRPRRVAPGARADVVVLRAPLARVLEDPSSSAVAATVIAGELA